MSNTYKDKARILRKLSRKEMPLPKGKVISPNKKVYKRKAKHAKANVIG